MRPRTDGHSIDVLNEFPEEFDSGKPDGVAQPCLPMYYEVTDQQASEVIRSGGDREPREPRWKAPIHSIIEGIADTIGWEGLFEFGEEEREH